ncbi:hypothetical protein Nepgr_004552 [Nepenthes gracilis]|uniref:Uncharacterized protein n=1 Tax=Nepenthes gracilis TaxID=150966 RepID=A0AAD3XFB0_NEPGR|nr:hypothetical protein Nepgr_004552 [Nepenthes gracilis]
MGEIDPAFIQDIEHRPKLTITETQQIPLVDLSSVSSLLDSLSDYNDSNIDQYALIAEIGDACQKWGFFQVINHGVPFEKIEKIDLAARKFFSLSMEEKRKVRRDEANPLGYYESEHTKNVRDWKEVFDCVVRDPAFFPVSPDDLRPKRLINQWPDYPPELREACQEYGREVEKLAFKLLELIALSLGVAADKLRVFFKENTNFMRLNHYPPCPSPHLALGVGRHKDSGALIINVGDIIQVWSNDKYESVEHRVMVNSDRDRLSIPFFFNPAHYVMVEPLEELVNEQNPAKYESYSWGKFVAARKKSNFKKLDVENVQISNFRVSK